VRPFSLPGNLAVSELSAMGQTEIDGNTSGRVANKGMEGLALTPNGKRLVGVMQAPLIQDGGKIIRIVTIDIATGAGIGIDSVMTDPNGKRLYVATTDDRGSRLVVVDTETAAVDRTVWVG